MSWPLCWFVVLGFLLGLVLVCCAGLLSCILVPALVLASTTAGRCSVDARSKQPFPLQNRRRSRCLLQDYMAHLEALMAGIPRALLVAGQKDADVITMYS